MKNARTQNEFMIESPQSAHIRGLQLAIAAAALAATIFAGMSLALFTSANAFELNASGDDPEYVMAYAEPLPQRFGAFGNDIIAPEPEFMFEDEHELNDAWLGMSVISEDGVNVGYIMDAFIDETGALDELVLIPASKDVLAEPVYVPARFAKLGSTAVHITLTVNALATLEIAGDYAYLAE
jgi:hypothetical protein